MAPVEDIRALKPFLSSGPDVGALLLIFLAVVALLGAIAYFLRRPRRTLGFMPESRMPPTLRGRLAALRSSGLAERGEAAVFCDQLAEIMRDFLAQRYGISSRRLTSSELLAELERQGVGLTVRDPLESIFAAIDLVKFAKVRLPAPELTQQLTTATLVLDLAGSGGIP